MTSPARAAVRRAVVVAGVTWLALSVAIVLSNVVFARAQDDDDGVAVVVAYSAVFVALLVTGRLAAGVAADSRIQALAGAIAGALVGSFTTATLFAMDNIFLSIVAKQQMKIDGLARSGMTSMREYLNTSLVGPLLFWTVAFAVFGAVLAVVGGAFARPSRQPPASNR